MGGGDDCCTITVGEVTSLPYGEEPTVENVGTDKDAIFDFGIPEGKQRDDGTEGKDGEVIQKALPLKVVKSKR